MTNRANQNWPEGTAIEIDYATAERQQSVSNSQPLRVNWVAIWAYLSAFLLSGAIWRCIYLFALRVCR